MEISDEQLEQLRMIADVGRAAHKAEWNFVARDMARDIEEWLEHAKTCEPAVINHHRAIWRESHEPLGITLAESKQEWLALLEGDPLMRSATCWGDLAGRVPANEIQKFHTWLGERADAPERTDR